MADSFSSLVDRIRSRFVDLSPQQRIAAAFVLKRPEDVAIVSMRTLAAHAGVQPVTFVRLARTLGFSAWEDFKEPFVERMRVAPALYSDRAKRLAEVDPREVHLSHLKTLEATQGLNDTPTFAAAAEAFERAPNVFVAGFRACFGPAHAFAYVYRLFRPDVVLLSGMGGGLEAELRAVDEEDVVVVMGFRPYSRESVIVAEHAARRGATVIAITDSPLAPFAREAKIVLTFSTEGPSFFPSLVSAWAIAEQLLDVIVARGGDAVLERLKSAEAQLQALGVFVPAYDASDN
ncbi:MurR/RpiR family transcriptional regulator [Terrihabitans rhizophilus]|uniref:MurR/RpiR family transcriptional regulator n=1 Tax=Terrihabitans rhizophilus TaxID=3092662 RepID=A0ABU4RP85_9HYPH|nr:MurR/RpiR family transcriptional regulator [Terrihabitans sp. PJ23]MDX6806639.1 MurR/RpiR family transcriptional regulator [Terrihabitans sp. PJ23]